MGGHWFMLQLRGLILFLPSQELILRALPITPLAWFVDLPGAHFPDSPAGHWGGRPMSFVEVLSRQQGQSGSCRNAGLLWSG